MYVVNIDAVFTAWNRTQSKVAPLIEFGAKRATNISELVKNNDVILIIVGNDVALDYIYENSDGIKSQDLKNKIIIELSTTSVEKMKSLEQTIQKKIVTSTGALELKEVPKKMIVIGAGVIGLEMGTVWRRLGSEVEVIEYLPRILPGMDNEVAEKFMKILEKQGLNFKLGHAVESTKIVEDKVILSIRDVAKENIEEIEADVVLVAVGRKPNTNGNGQVYGRLMEMTVEVRHL